VAGGAGSAASDPGVANGAATPVEIAGAEVTTLQLDVTDEAALAKLPPIDGIIHAAGVLDDGLLVTQTAERMKAVLAPKVAGARALHRLTQGRALDFFVLCSSAASLFGNPGQAAYAAGNAYLDGLAEMRRAHGETALSVNLGPVADAGMAARSRRSSEWSAAGVGLLPMSAIGPALLEASRSGAAQVLVMRPGEPAAAQVKPVAASRRKETGRSVAEAVREAVAHVLGSGDVAEDRPLGELGLDSLMAVELRNRLARELERPLPATLAFDYPTVAALVAYLEGTKPAAAAGPLEAHDEAIAIIGMGCRMPGGANSPEQLWQLLASGIDAIGEAPRERWDVDAYYDPDPATPGKMSTRWGGFLQDIDRFDAAFFGIAPREAISMDPQHRMLLEVSWEALERAGIAPGSLAGSATGVFIGISTNDYSLLHKLYGDLPGIDAYTGTGSAVSVAAGRLSYVLGLQGPCMAVDTACSSSLTAVHLACQSLRNGECGLALVGGVNLILTPEGMIYFSKLGVMAPDGRCKTFDAAADGYVRSEGCGVVVLKRLSEAVRDGDPVLAVVRGSAVNQDGRSSGLTAPNGPAQEAVIRSALQRGGVSPNAVGYVEAHGTGTALGDPIEVQALSAALADGRSTSVLIGSVKTNVGHLEAAAGIAGLMKAVLAVQHAQIPPSLHFRNPSPHVQWQELPVQIPTALAPWPEQYRTRIAGVSSFGFSGTNAHVVIEQPPQSALTVSAPELGPHLLPVSARSTEALQTLTEEYAAILNDAVSLRDVCFTASRRRSHHEHRIAVVAGSAEEMQAGLLTARRGRLSGERRKLGFVFPGQGGQHAGMARSLLAQESVFRRSIEECHRAFSVYTDWSLLELLQGNDESWLGEIDRIQPAIFAVQTALTTLWRSWGVEPDGVIGHSMGEVAAAHAAGVLTLEDAARIICRRSALLKRIQAGGAMLVVDLPARDIGPLDRLSIAASNGPRTTVVAGDEDALTAFAETLERRGVFCRRVQVSVAAHTSQVDALAPSLAEALAGVMGTPGSIPFYSTVTGAVQRGEDCKPAYWMTNLRQPVQFWNALQTMIGDGFRTFIELSPHPVLGPSVEDGLKELAVEGEVRASLRRGEEDRRVMLETLATLYRQGQPVDWGALYPEGNHVSLPTYPWQRKRFWLEDRRRASPQTLQRVNVSLPGVQIWQCDVNDAVFAGHRVQNEVVCPAAAFIDMAHAAGNRLDGIRFEQMLVLRPGETRRVQLVVEGERFRISSCLPEAETQSPWTLHATGSIATASAECAATDVSEIIRRCPESLEPGEFYTTLSTNGLDYTDEFRGISQLWRGDGEAIAKLSLSGSPAARLDCCLQVLAAVAPAAGAFVPVATDTVEYGGHAGGELWAHARLTSTAAGAVQGDITALDGNGMPVVRITALRAVRTGDDLRNCWYALQWRRIEAPPNARVHSKANWAVVAGQPELAAQLRGALEQAGESCVTLTADLPCGGVIAMCNTADSLLELVQTLAQTGWRDAPRLYVVTRGAQAIHPEESPNLTFAPVWGLARTIALEHPELRCTRLDLDPNGGADELRSLCDVCLADGPEQEIAFRSGALYVSRLVRSPIRTIAPSDSCSIRPDATYLITGAFGGIGLTVARWLVTRGARHLLLIGRRGPSEAAAAVLQELRDAGATVISAAADVGNFAELSQVIAMAEPALCGVFHCAGVLDDGIVIKLNRERLHAVMKPKVEGAWNLHRLTASLSLDHFVLFSSAASLLGSPGQANYSAANAYLDALAHYRHGLSLPALSVNWGPWAEIGLAAAQENRGRRLAAQGLGSLTPEQGIRALELLLGQANAPPAIAVLPFNLRQWREFYPAAAGLPLFAELMQEAGPHSRSAPAAKIDSAATLESHVRGQVAAGAETRTATDRRLRCVRQSWARFVDGSRNPQPVGKRPRTHAACESRVDVPDGERAHRTSGGLAADRTDSGDSRSASEWAGGTIGARG
jgi:myxalamid-type polyketide synthase MxaE and MxaD